MLFQRIKVSNLLVQKKVEKNELKMVFWSNLVGSCVVIGTCACHYGWVTENNPKPTLLFPLVTVWHSLRMPQWGQNFYEFKSVKFQCPKGLVITRKSRGTIFYSFCRSNRFLKQSILKFLCSKRCRKFRQGG